MPFVTLRESRNLFKNLLPQLSSNCREILLDLAAAQQLNQPLTMKQLLLLQGGTATTVRRRISRLIEHGHVVKLPNVRDGRSDHFGVSESLQSEMENVHMALQLIHAKLQLRAGTYSQPDANPQLQRG